MPSSELASRPSITDGTTSLPRLSPKSTPIITPPPGVKAPKVCTPPKLITKTGAIQPKTLQNINVPSVYEVYPQKPITSVDVRDFQGMHGRHNPLRPPQIRRTAVLETTDLNWENQKRSQMMQRMSRLRYHTAYEKYPYGSPAEKEIYRRLFREGLKEQMSDLDRRKQLQFSSKVTESRDAVIRDQNDLRDDAEKFYNHHQFMTTYRDANKEIMEQAWNRSRQQQRANVNHELELLRYNPINWSCTLK